MLFKDNIEYFCHTSGTTEKQKLIPVTKKSRLTSSKYMGILLQKFAYENFKEKWSYERGLLISDMITTTYTPADIPICSATAGGMKAIKHILPFMYTSPIEVMYVKDKNTALYLHLLFALRDNKLMYIAGVFISNILDLLRKLEYSYKYLVDDIKKGRINKKLNISDKMRKKLNSYLTPNASRAEQLDKEFKKGFNGICKRIWPNLTYLACVAGASFSIYHEPVNYYTGNIPIYSPCLSASEGTFGINKSSKDIKYIIIPDTVFYEFIKAEDSYKENPKTFCINEFNACPEVIFLYRRNQILNIASEKTTEEHITSAIQNTIRKALENTLDLELKKSNLA